jgi:hypothetical protein
MNTIYYKLKKHSNKINYIYINLYNDIGFGNLLFMVINGLALSYEYNREVKLIRYNSNRADRPNIKKYQIFKSMKFIKKIEVFDAIEHTESNPFTYNKINLTDHNYIINGYYQSYKYSNKYIDKIKAYLFENITDLIEKTKLNTNKKTILLHVRRGDYYNSNEHYIIEESHYEKSLIDFFEKNNKDDYQVFLFTDGIDEVSTWQIIKDYNIIPINENNPEIIFLLMIQFDHYIIANSSLSLLSYYFRNNKDATIVFPPLWVVGVNSYDDMDPTQSHI